MPVVLLRGPGSMGMTGQDAFVIVVVPQDVYTVCPMQKGRHSVPCGAGGTFRIFWDDERMEQRGQKSRDHVLDVCHLNSVVLSSKAQRQS
jgi:hypothetical protein